MTRNHLLVLAMLAAGCTDFATVNRNICGNGILEPGEDCDSSSDPACIACVISCADTPCPPGYTCGVEHTCQAPGGALGAPTDPQVFPVDDFRLSDIDKDGRKDLLGVSRTSVSVRFGDATGNVTRSSSFVTPTQTGTPSFGDLDADGATDVVIATYDGLVGFASGYKTLSPLVASAQLGSATGTIQMVFPIDTIVTGAFYFETTGELKFLVGDLRDNQPASTSSPCIGPPVAGTEFAPELVDSFQLPRRSTITVNGSIATIKTTDDLIVSLMTKTGRACVMGVHAEVQTDSNTTTGASTTTLKVIQVTPVTPPGIATNTTGATPSRLVLADLSGDSSGCPSIVDTHVVGKNLTVWDGQYHTAGVLNPTDTTRCEFKGPTTRTLPDDAPAELVPIGRVPILPRTSGLQPDALVTDAAIYPMSGTNFYEAYRSQRPLGAVAFGDLDGDGQIDAVAASPNEDDLDALFRTDVTISIFGIPVSLAVFQLYRVDTANDVARVAVGDFDGDGVDDIAYTEQVVGHERMLIAYGTLQRPEPPVEVATFGTLLSLIPTSFPDSSDPLSLATDLIVVDVPPNETIPVATILHGSPQRTLLSFYAPDTYDPSAELLRGSIIGNFLGSSAADLVALSETHAWVVAGNGAGFNLSFQPPETDLTQSHIGHCGGNAGSGGGSKFCTDTASYLTWSMGATDVIFGVDREAKPHGVLVVPPTGPNQPLDATVLPAMTKDVPAGAVLHALYASDLDGDMQNELVETFGPPRGVAPATGGIVLVCKMTGSTLGTCTDVRTTIAAADTTIKTCIDATPARFSFHDTVTLGPPGAELAVLCYDDAGTSSLWSVVHGDTATVVARDLGALRAIRAGDITGDGVDDLVGLRDGGDGQTLVIFPQCSSRDTACARAGSK